MNEGGDSDAGREEEEVMMAAMTNLYVMHPLVISKVNTAAVTCHTTSSHLISCVLAPAATARQSWGKQLPTTDA